LPIHSPNLVEDLEQQPDLIHLGVDHHQVIPGLVHVNGRRNHNGKNSYSSRVTSLVVRASFSASSSPTSSPLRSCLSWWKISWFSRFFSSKTASQTIFPRCSWPYLFELGYILKKLKVVLLMEMKKTSYLPGDLKS